MIKPRRNERTMWLYVLSVECSRANARALVMSGVSGTVTPANTLVGRELADAILQFSVFIFLRFRRQYLGPIMEAKVR